MSSPVEVHQALFGYDRGHRFLAGSVSLEPDAVRALRTASDMSFEGKSDEYLTVMPVPGTRFHAFIRTWLAQDWVRVGSVWSHVLLLDSVAVGRLSSFGGLPELFRQPHVSGTTISDLDSYRDSVPWRPAPRRHATSRAVDAAPLLGELYGSVSAVRSVGSPASQWESALLAIHEQQWPRLRRSFAYRTRYRASDLNASVDIEIVERPGSAPLVSRGEEGWARFLSADLQRPDAAFRTFITSYGAEGTSRQDMRVLTEAYEALSDSSQVGEAAADLILASYPRPDQMRGLKREVFGREPSEKTPGRWRRVSEETRLSFVLRHINQFDFDELEVARRLADVLSSERPIQQDLAETFSIVDLSPSQLDAVVSEVVGRSNFALSDGALQHEELGLLIVARQPELLADGRVWEALDADSLLAIFDESGENAQRQVLETMLAARDVEGLAALCSAAPARWWVLVAQAADPSAPMWSIFAHAETLRLVLDRVGPASLPEPPRRPKSQGELIIVLLAAELTAGLWRRALASDWLRVWTDGWPLATSPEWISERLASVALVSGIVSKQPNHRTRAWLSTFGFLHEALKASGFDDEAWRLLRNALPAGPEWDRCRRLRIGAVSEIKRDDWQVESVRRLVRDAREFGLEIDRGAINAKKSKKRRTWLEEILHLFTGS